MSVPALRFPEFEGEWEKKRLGQLGTFKNGYNADKSSYGFGVPFVNLMDIFGQSTLGDQDLGLVDAKPKDVETYSVRSGDILFVRSSVKRTGVGQACFVERDFPNTVFSGFIIRYRCKPKTLEAGFKKYCLSIPPVRKQVLSLATSSANTNINQENLSVVDISFPSLPEQKKIAAFLGVVDAKIAALRERRAGLERYKRGLMQALFSQTLRFTKPDGTPFPDWEEKRFSEFLVPNFRAVPKPLDEYLAIGIRSHGKGTFQKPKSDPAKIAMETLYVVRENDLIVNITFAWEGAIAIVSSEDDGGHVSHRFPTYVFKEALVSHDFFRIVISDLRFRQMLDLISPGGAGRNRVMSKPDFLKLRYLFPHPDEQAIIADALSAMDTKIAAVSGQVAQMEAFKKGLLQQMFV